MVMPLVALCALAMLQLVGVVRDALLAQDLARIGARVAAVDPSHEAVARAIASAAGPDVATTVTILPPMRRHGDTITVEVRLQRPGGLLDVELTGRAATHGEPVLDRGGP